MQDEHNISKSLVTWNEGWTNSRSQTGWLIHRNTLTVRPSRKAPRVDSAEPSGVTFKHVPEQTLHMMNGRLMY